MGHPTILDVAQRAGVSKSLVSLVMRDAPHVSDEKRRAVLLAAREVGYRPNAAARTLSSRRTHVVGLMLSDLHNPFFAEVADGIMEAASEVGYRILINTGSLSAEREAEAIETLLELRTDGVILASPQTDVDVIRRASEIVPLVLVNRATSLPSADSVINDDRAGARLVVDHLASLGHRRIAHIDGGNGSGAVRRRSGFEAAMQQHGLGRWMRVVPGRYTEEAGEAGVRELLAGGRRPTAIFAANDYQAVGALNALQEAGLRTPSDISVVGYDDIRLASLGYINLTTVNQPRLAMGRRAVEVLQERIAEGRTRARRVVLPPRLVVRSSTGPPPP